MIGHDHMSMEIESGDGLLPEIERSAMRREGLACVRFVRWRIKVMRQAVVKVPGHEKELVPGRRRRWNSIAR
jgi:hypothetical protein